MIEENLQEHEAATEPKTAAQQAAEIEFSQISTDLDRKVLDEIAKQQGITADALNMSVSKFKKLNKGQLVDAIKAGKPEEQAKEQPKPQDEFDVLAFGMGLFNVVAETSKREGEDKYKKLDSFIMSAAVERVSKSDSSININTNPQLVTNLLLSGSIVYGVARIIGFDRIKAKAEQLKIKILGGTPVNEPQSKE